MGKNSNPQTSTQSSAPPAQVLADYQGLVNRGTAAANVPYTPYQGEQVAPMTGQTQAGLGNVNNYAFAAQPGYQTAANMTQGAWSGAQPYQQGANSLIQGSAHPFTPTQFSAGAVNQYQSPYTQDVVNATQNQFNNQNQQQSQFLNSANISSGNSPFAGDRAGIGQAILANQQISAQAPVIAGLENQGYAQALGEFNNQQQTGLQAQVDSAQQALAAGQGLGQLGLGYGNLGLNSAGQFGNLANASQAAGLQGASAQMQAGMIPQQQQQAIDQALMSQYAQSQAYPFQTTGWLGNLIEGLGSQMGGSSQTSTPPPSQSSQWLGAGITGLGLLNQISDERAKEDIEPVGKTFDNQTIYRFRYKNDPRTQIGLIAQETEKKHPGAVHEAGLGRLKSINYRDATQAAAQRGHFDAGGAAVGPPRPGAAPSISPQAVLAMLGSRGAMTGLNPQSISANAYTPQGILARQGFPGGGSVSYPASPDAFIDFDTPTAIASGVGAPNPLSGVAAIEYAALTNNGQGVSGNVAAGGGNPGGTLTPEAPTPGPQIKWNPALYQGYGNPTYAGGNPVVPNFSPGASGMGASPGTPGVAFPTSQAPAGGSAPAGGAGLAGLTGGSVSNPGPGSNDPQASTQPQVGTIPPFKFAPPNKPQFVTVGPGTGMGYTNYSRVPVRAAGGMIGQSGLHHAMGYVPQGHGLTGMDSQGQGLGSIGQFGGMFGSRDGFAGGGSPMSQAPWSDVVTWVPGIGPLQIGAGPPRTGNIQQSQSQSSQSDPLKEFKSGQDMGKDLSSLGSKISNLFSGPSSSGGATGLSGTLTGTLQNPLTNSGAASNDLSSLLSDFARGGRAHRDFGGGIGSFTPNAGFTPANAWAGTPGIAGNEMMAGQGLGFAPTVPDQVFDSGSGPGNAGLRSVNPNMPQNITAPFTPPTFGNSMAPESWNTIAAGTADQAMGAGSLPPGSYQTAGLGSAGWTPPSYHSGDSTGNYTGNISSFDRFSALGQPRSANMGYPALGLTGSGRIPSQPGDTVGQSTIGANMSLPGLQGMGYPALGMSPYAQASAWPAMGGQGSEGLNPQTSAALAAMQEALAKQGYHLGDPISGQRTYQDQQEIYADALAKRAGQPLPFPERGPVTGVAAYPGTSPHEFGAAFDTGLGGSALNYANQIAPNLGLNKVSNDPGHFQLMTYAGPGTVKPSINAPWGSHVSLAPAGRGYGTPAVNPTEASSYFHAKGGAVPMPPPRPADALPADIAFRVKNFPEYKEGQVIPSSFMDQYVASTNNPMLTRPPRNEQKFGYDEGEPQGSVDLGSIDSAVFPKPRDPSAIDLWTGGSARRHFDDGGDTSAPRRGFADSLAMIESENQNVYSKVDPDVAGPGTRSQGYFQINTPTWSDFAPKAGVDTSKYPNAMSAPREVQQQVASAIPLSRFGPRTQKMLMSQYGPLDLSKPVGAYSGNAPSGNAQPVQSMAPNYGGGFNIPNQAPPPDNRWIKTPISPDAGMAMMAAGLGIMGGRSPYASVNIGQGGLEGMKYLQNERQYEREYGLSQAEIRHYDAETAQSVLNLELERQYLTHANDPGSGSSSTIGQMGHGVGPGASTASPSISTTVPGPIPKPGTGGAGQAAPTAVVGSPLPKMGTTQPSGLAGAAGINTGATVPSGKGASVANMPAPGAPVQAPQATSPGNPPVAPQSSGQIGFDEHGMWAYNDPRWNNVDSEMDPFAKRKESDALMAEASGLNYWNPARARVKEQQAVIANQRAIELENQYTQASRTAAQEQSGALAKANPQVAQAEANKARQVASATEAGKNMPENDNEEAAAQSTRNDIEAKLNQLFDLNEKLRTGPAMPIQQILSQYGQYFNVDPKLATNAQEFEKLALSDMYKELTQAGLKGQVRNMEISGFMKQMPELIKTPGANADILLNSLGMIDKANAYGGSYWDWRKTPEGQTAFSEGPFQGQWNRQPENKTERFINHRFTKYAQSHPVPAGVPPGAVLGIRKNGAPVWRDPSGKMYDWQGNPE